MSAEPKPDIGVCSICEGRFMVHELKTEKEGDWETGYYDIHVCPKCPGGGCIDDYDMSPEVAEAWNKWYENENKQ